MKNNPSVVMAGRDVGQDHPPVFVAEVGTFFNKDMEKAEALLDGAVRGGAHLFKTEILHRADVCLKNTGLVHAYHHAGGVAEEDYRALVERKLVALEDYARLFEMCRERKIAFLASVYDLEGIDFLAAQGAAAIKISRDNVNNIPLLRHTGKTGLPVVMDVAGHYLEEIAAAVRTLEAAGASGVILNHHPAANPAPFKAHNLRIIDTYQEVFGRPVGLSCHFRGDQLIYLAVARGACLIEKGVFDDPDAKEQDIVSALDVRDLPGVVQTMADCWSALGAGDIRGNPTRDEASWKGLVALQDIARGDVLGTANLGFAWPPVGISVSHWDLVAGKTAARDISRDQPLEWEMVRL